MGCDIHMYVEYKKKDSDKWENGDFFRLNPYGYLKGESKFSVVKIHGDRNYSLFSTLAGIRDYTEKVKPVADPKDFPEDACKLVKNEFIKWDSDAHTPSWLTLKELRDYQDTNPVLHFSGMVSPETAIALDEEGKSPNEWCQWTSNTQWVFREWKEPNTELVPLIKKLEDRALELFPIWSEYDRKYDESIRIVFWFDN